MGEPRRLWGGVPPWLPPARKVSRPSGRPLRRRAGRGWRARPVAAKWEIAGAPCGGRLRLLASKVRCCPCGRAKLWYVAELFQVIFQVGEDASVAVLAGMVTDLDVVAQGGLGLAGRAAEVQADSRLAYLAREGGPRRLLEEARRLGLAESPDAADDLERWWYELDDLGWGHPRRRSRWLLPFLLSSPGGNEPGARLLDQLRSREVAGLLPQQPYRFRSLRYENPLAVEIVSDGGLAAAALLAVLRVIRDWAPRRRLLAARADDAEDRAWFRARCRRFAIEQISQGELSLTSEMVRDLLSDDLVDAVDELSARQRSMEHQQLPGTDGG